VFHLLSSKRRFGTVLRRRHAVRLFAVSALVAVCLWLAAGTARAAVSARLQWVEVDVGLREDGKADIVYKVRWNVSSGEMHGFYLEGMQETPVFNFETSHAEAGGRTYPLSITKVGKRKYDVVLAGGKALGPGENTYIVHYAADLVDSRNLGLTEAPDLGPLVVLGWAPVQWDEALEHYTVYVHYPVEVPPERAAVEGEVRKVAPEFLEEVVFRTEKFMNEQYLIDYRATPSGGNDWLTILLHKKSAPAKFHFLVQPYISAQYFPA